MLYTFLPLGEKGDFVTLNYSLVLEFGIYSICMYRRHAKVDSP